MDALKRDPKILLRLEKHFSSVRLPVFALRRLGLMRTLAVAGLADLDPKSRNKFLMDSGFLDRVIFRLDAATQFENWERVLPSWATASKVRRSPSLPLADSSSNALQRYLALEHFRSLHKLHKSSDFFAAVLPEDTSVQAAVDFPFRALREVLASGEAPADAYLADDGDVLVFEREDGGPLFFWGSRARTDVALLNARDHRFARVAVFKVEKWQPSLLKQVKGTGASATTSLTASDIAVAMFSVVHVKTGADAAEDQVLYTTAVAQGSDGTFAGAVALVNEALFMTSVFRFQVLPEKIFLWEGPLDCGSQKDMDEVVQALTLAGAVPGPGKSLVCSAPVAKRKRGKTEDPQVKLLQKLAEFRWVQAHVKLGFQPQGFLFTDAGYRYVRPCVGLTKPVSVLRLRHLEDRSAWTRFEVMLYLRDKGWVALPMAKRKKGLKLQLRLSESSKDKAAAPSSAEDVGSRPGQTWLFGPKPPQVSKAYLQAMLAIEDHREFLLSAGAETVCHVASAEYFKCLCKMVSGSASLAELCALEPGRTKAVDAADAVLAFETDQLRVLSFLELEAGTPKPEAVGQPPASNADLDALSVSAASPSLPPSPLPGPSGS